MFVPAADVRAAALWGQGCRGGRSLTWVATVCVGFCSLMLAVGTVLAVCGLQDRCLP